MEIANLLNFDHSGDSMEVVQSVATSQTGVAAATAAATTSTALFNSSVDVTTPTDGGGASHQRPKNSIHFLLNSNDAMDVCSSLNSSSNSESQVSCTKSRSLRSQSPPKALSPSEAHRRRKLSRRGGRAYDEQLTNVYDEDEGEDEHAMRLFLLQQREKEKRLFSSSTSSSSPTGSSCSSPTSKGGLLENFPLPAHSIEQLLPLASRLRPSSPYVCTPGNSISDPIGSPQMTAQKKPPLNKPGEFSGSQFQIPPPHHATPPDDQPVLLHPPLPPAGEATLFGSSLHCGGSPCPGSPILASSLLSPSNRHSHQLVPTASSPPAMRPPLERNPAIHSLKSFREQTAMTTPSPFVPSPYCAVLQHHQTVPTQQHQHLYRPAYAGPQQGHPYSLHCPTHTQQTQTQTPTTNPTERPEEQQRLTREQKTVLEAVFELDPRPSAKTKRTLAGELGMSLRSVQMWFQNQRAKLRKHDKDFSSSPKISSLNQHGTTAQWAERSESTERNRSTAPPASHSLVFHNMRAKTEADGAFLLVAEDP